MRCPMAMRIELRRDQHSGRRSYMARKTREKAVSFYVVHYRPRVVSNLG